MTEDRPIMANSGLANVIRSTVSESQPKRLASKELTNAFGTHESQLQQSNRRHGGLTTLMIEMLGDVGNRRRDPERSRP